MTLPVRAFAAALATLVAAALLSLVVTAPASSAAARQWGPLQRLDGASRLQACKVPAGDTAWRVWVRVNNRGGDQWVKGTMTVIRNGVRTDRRWASARIAAGDVSAAGSVLLPRRAGWYLEATLSAAQMGGGGEYTAGRIRGC